MKKYLLFLLLFIATAVAAFSQTPTPTPDTDVVKISTSLIRLDVTVTDAKGKAIADLKPDEIEIYENGEKQKITSLSFVSGSARKIVPKIDPADKTAIPIPPAQLRPEQIRRTIALIVDDLTLSFESTYQTRRALKKFVDEQMEDGDLVAIIRTGAGIGALQQFTSDKRILYAAIEKVKWNPLGTGGVSAFAPLEEKTQADPDAEEPLPGERTQEGFEREFRDFRDNFFVTGSLGALDFVIRGMSELPGRKSVVLFSDGFAMLNTDATGVVEASTVLGPLKKLIENANRASVVVYAMDPRGLVYTGLTAADNTSGRTTEEVDKDLSDRRTKLSDTQDALRYISEETGGFAIVDSNDISGGVQRVLEDQSYYLVSYEPDSDTFDQAKRKFNKVEVKVLRKGATARYRSGFFNVADREKTVKPVATSASPAEQLQAALLSPFAVSGINLRLNALFGNDPKNVSFVRSLLHVTAADLQFTDIENGRKKAVFDVLAISFGDNGQAIDQLSKSYTLTVTPDAYKRAMTDGFVYHFLFPIKKAGPYQYRVAIRDMQSGRIGSASQFIEVPDLKKKRLTLSSIVLESLSEETMSKAAGGAAYESNPMTDTALRRVRLGSVLRAGFEVYNARPDSAKHPQLTAKVRIFHDGKLILDGKQSPVEFTGQSDLQHIRVSRALSLGRKTAPGDYILQIIIRDEQAKPKDQIATQFIQFEIVE